MAKVGSAGGTGRGEGFSLREGAREDVQLSERAASRCGEIGTTNCRERREVLVIGLLHSSTVSEHAPGS